MLHPALHGRELAWSAARVDFWINSPSDLYDEALILNPSSDEDDFDLARYIGNVFQHEIVTWQFYERPATISVRKNNVANSEFILKNEDSLPGRFAISFFSKDTDQASSDPDGVILNSEASTDFQPALDWLLESHVDFMRLNDYSESSMLLRWIRKYTEELVVVDMDGDISDLPAPDRIDSISVSPLVEK